MLDRLGNVGWGASITICVGVSVRGSGGEYIEIG